MQASINDGSSSISSRCRSQTFDIIQTYLFLSVHPSRLRIISPTQTLQRYDFQIQNPRRKNGSWLLSVSSWRLTWLILLLLATEEWVFLQAIPTPVIQDQVSATSFSSSEHVHVPYYFPLPQLLTHHRFFIFIGQILGQLDNLHQWKIPRHKVLRLCQSECI